MRENQHITPEDLLLFHDNRLAPDQLIRFMEEIDHCPHCAEAFSDSFLETRIVTAPLNFKAMVLDRSQMPDVQLAVKAGQTSRYVSSRLRLLLYSLKVGAAVLAALFLLFFLPVPQAGASRAPEPPAAYSPEPTFLERVLNDSNHLSSSMRTFSDQLINKEENQYD